MPKLAGTRCHKDHKCCSKHFVLTNLFPAIWALRLYAIHVAKSLRFQRVDLAAVLLGLPNLHTRWHWPFANEMGPSVVCTGLQLVKQLFLYRCGVCAGSAGHGFCARVQMLVPSADTRLTNDRLLPGCSCFLYCRSRWR